LLAVVSCRLPTPPDGAHVVQLLLLHQSTKSASSRRNARLYSKSPSQSGLHISWQERMPITALSTQAASPLLRAGALASIGSVPGPCRDWRIPK
jgi:hypothetical protein